MRLLKKHDKINISPKTDKIKPFRSFYLSSDELEKLNNFKIRNDGELVTNAESEALLKEFLETRGMGSLLYPELEREDWSGYVKVFDSGLLWML